MSTASISTSRATTGITPSGQHGPAEPGVATATTPTPGNRAFFQHIGYLLWARRGADRERVRVAVWPGPG